MKSLKCPWLWTTALSLSLLASAAAATAQDSPRPIQFLGADVSALAAPRPNSFGRASTRPAPTRPAPARIGRYEENGKPGSEIDILMRHGFNAFRLRVFVAPVRRAPNNSLENTLVLAKQIKSVGTSLILDLHYSDTWADPQHQEIPDAWKHLAMPDLENQVETYSAQVIAQLKAAGAMPDMVQVGNEITGGMLWPIGQLKVPLSTVKAFSGIVQPIPVPNPYDDATQWSNLTRLIKAGVRGVRRGAGDSPVKIIIHIDCGGDWPITQWYFDHLTAAGVDYDIIGQSFYPNYHGTLAELRQNITNCHDRYHKPFIVAETGYPQNGGDRVMTRRYMAWPGTPQGQLQFMADLINTAAQSPPALGVFYWAPESRGGGNGLWNSDGSPAPAISVLDHLAEGKRK